MKVIRHRNLRRDGPDGAGRDGVDRRLPLGIVEPQLVHPLAELDRPATRPKHDAHGAACFQIDSGRVELRVAQRLVGCRQRHRDDARDVADVFRVDPRHRIEVNFAGDAARK